MKGTQLGEFEELVLRTITLLYDDAFIDEAGKRLERLINLTPFTVPDSDWKKKDSLPPRLTEQRRNGEVGGNDCLPSRRLAYRPYERCIETGLSCGMEFLKRPLKQGCYGAETHA